MISNSVTHLQSYTNTAIAENSAPSADVTSPSADVSTSNGECFMMLHNALRVSYVLLVVHDVLLIV